MRMAVLGHFAGLGSAHIIQRLVHLGDDVDSVEDVERIYFERN